jgi:hypothetical protein
MGERRPGKLGCNERWAVVFRAVAAASILAEALGQWFGYDPEQFRAGNGAETVECKRR